MMKVLVFDPAGNMSKKEGFGITGYAIFHNGELSDFGSIKSEDFDTQEHYWLEHSAYIEEEMPDTVLIESYKLFAHKSAAQSWSTMDTPQLIGYLRMVCWKLEIPVYFQDPGDKVRVADDILVKQGYLEKKSGRYYCLNRSTVLHMRDAIRHGIFFHKYGKGRKLLDVYNNSKRTLSRRN